MDTEKYKDVLKLRAIKGIWWHDMHKLENVEDALEYKARDGDIVLVAYTKTGSTWLMYIVWEILHKGAPYHGMNDTYNKYIPCIEMTGKQVIEELPAPRFFKCHIPMSHMNLNKNAKYIYIHRRPDDVMVSSYYYNKMYTDKEYDFDFFFEAFMSGNVLFNDIFDHVLFPYAHKDDDNFLLVSFEQLKANTRQEILRIAKFLGEEHERTLRNDEGLLRRILGMTSFSEMKKNLAYDIPTDPAFQGEKEFFRKGEIGDGKNHLSEQQRKKMDAKIAEKMKGTDLMEAWLT